MFLLTAYLIPSGGHATGTVIITIQSDGDINPSTVPIISNGSLYRFTSQVRGVLFVERDNIVIDGANYTLKVATGCPVSKRDGIFLDGKENVTIENVNVRFAWYGISLENCVNITISGCRVTKSIHAIRVRDSEKINVIDCVLVENYHHGLQLYNSTDTSIQGNIMEDNGEDAVFLEESSDNRIVNNSMDRNLDGIVLIHSMGNEVMLNNISGNVNSGFWTYMSSENHIQHNNLIDNGEQALSIESWNSWGNNYWSDYHGVDSDDDGLGEQPYVIDMNNQDPNPRINVIPEFPGIIIFPLLLLITSLICLLRRFV